LRTLWRVLLCLGALLLALAAVLTFNTVRLQADPLAKSPPPLPIDAAAVQRLAQALRIPTVSTEAATPSPQSLAALHALLVRSFPRAHAALTREELQGGALLYTWQGSDPSAPALLLLAHQDVVPVEEGSAHKWTYPPFRGSIGGGFVWGRGAIDDKGSLMAILEATERLLARGYRPRATVYLAFGQDEERGGEGARAIAGLLRKRGANVGLALDEGFAVLDGVIAGVRPPVSVIGVAEKGYVSVELSSSGSGGHSSMPSPDNPATRIARAITRLSDEPAPARLDGVTGETLDAIAPYTAGTMRIALANGWFFGPLIKRQFLGSPSTAASIRTTTATTIVQAGTKDNVLPQNARAVVNHRILPGESIETVIERDRRSIGDVHVALRALPFRSNPSRPASTRGAEYRQLASVVRATFPEAPVAPGLVLGATDGRHYEGVARAVLRFIPITMTKEDLARFHGNDERIAIADYMRAIHFYERLISTYEAAEGSGG
jgi:carboxypeptidase PM20D1